ncbi:alpha-L-rhamnosidase [Hufsiella ginkgonis]|nr:alpha-L-rhamnosidase [Hufsiella ginkgonis]
MLLLPGGLLFAQSPARVTSLRTEYLENPLGIDALNPRFTWRIADPRRGARQTAYQVFFGTDSAKLLDAKAGGAGMVPSASQLVTYKAGPLRPFTRYYWTVVAWDRDRKPSAKAKIASFETGMLGSENWQGTWISDILPLDSRRASTDLDTKRAPYFRKKFTAGKRIRSARAYIAAAGLYELYLNGAKSGNHRLDPMYTRFDRRNLYVTYDVTPMLRQGDNVIGVLLGNGWYNHQSTAVWFFDRAPWRNRPAFCLDLRITYEDGTTEVIKSGNDWKTSLGPITFNSIYTAEHYDGRLEQPGWNTVSFDDSKWKAPGIRSAPSRNVVAQAMHPIRDVEIIPARSMRKFNDTTYVFDLGRNIAGVSQFTVKGEAGTTLRLKHSERLYPNGRADLSNIDYHYRPTDKLDPFQVDIFILGGTGTETFKPKFNYKGFQYVEITSDRPITLSQSDVTGYFMHSDVPPAGVVSSANATIDKIWSATNNSYLSNLFGYPTDCPQREKNGWTGDAHIAIETGLYSFDAITVYEKWMADHRDEQQPNGVLPSIIPTGGWGYSWGNGPDWTSTIALVPWNLYLFYGDIKALRDCYPNIRRYVDHIDQESPSGLTSWGLGDWVPVKSKSPVELTSSIYYFTDASILAKAAKLLGHAADAEKYAALAAKIRNAINARYLDTATGIYGSGIQTELAAPLCWGVVPEAMKSKVAAQLAKRVAADNYHFDTGILGAKALLNALSENGYADVAYRVAAQETYPSWGWWIVNGATTLYENWDINAKQDISMNHIMFGEIGAWLYKAPGGIRPDPASPGFKNVLLEPHFVAGLDRFEAKHDGPYGSIISAWKRNGDKIYYGVTIPANSSATLKLAVGSGAALYEGGKLVTSNTKGIKQLAGNGNTRSYQVEAGNYGFEIK